MSRPRALITGASSGIGEALAHELARHGHDLVLVARSEGRLREIAGRLASEHGVQAEVEAWDLEDRESAPGLHRSLQEKGLPVDVLVNNAGFGLNGAFAELDLDRQTRMMELDMVALTRLTRVFLPDMLERKKGRILNVASTASFQPGPFMAVYYAAKAYVLSLSEALAEELRGTGVTVTALCPGPTRTGFQDASDVHGARLLKMLPVMDAETVARDAVRALQRGQAIVTPGFLNRVMAFSVRFTPRSLVTRMSRFMAEKA